MTDGPDGSGRGGTGPTAGGPARESQGGDSNRLQIPFLWLADDHKLAAEVYGPAGDLLPISWSSHNGGHLFVDSVDSGSGRFSSIGTYLTQVAENSAGVL